MNQNDDFRGGRNGGSEDGGAFDESLFSEDSFAGEIDERFADWVDGRLSPEEVAELEEEMVADDELRQRAEAYRDTVATLRVYLEGEEPPEDLIPSVMAQLPGRPGRRIIPFLASLTAAAAMVILYVVLKDLTDSPLVEEVPSAKMERAEGGDRDDASEPEKAKALARKPADYEGVKAQDDSAEQKRELTEDKLSEDLKKVAKSGSTKPTKADAPARAPAKRPVPNDGVPGTSKPDAGLRQRSEAKKPADESKNKEGGEKAENQAKSKAERTRRQQPGVATPRTPGPTSPSPKSRGRSTSLPSVGSEVRRLAKFYLKEVEESDRPAKKAESPVGIVHDEKSRRSESERKRQSRRSRSVGGGRGGVRGGRGGAIPAVETPVLLLTLSRRAGGAADRSTEREVDKAVPERSVSGKSRKKQAQPTKTPPTETQPPKTQPPKTQPPKTQPPKTQTKSDGKDRDAVEEEADTAGGKNAEKKKQSELGDEARRQGERKQERNLARFAVEKGLAGERVTGDSLALHFKSRGELRGAKLHAAGVLPIAPDPVVGFGRRPKSDAARGNTEASDDYAYRNGDKVYLVSGDDRQIRQFFVGLKGYLDARRSPRTGGPSGAAAPTEKSAAQKGAVENGVRARIPMAVKPLGASDARVLLRSAFAQAWKEQPKAGELRFLLVLREK